MATAVLSLSFSGAVSAVSPADTKGTLLTSGGAHEITIEVAGTPETREHGLMQRRAMPADHGMLFDFDGSRPVTMWMKDTLIPLDMLFMDGSGVVTRVKQRAQPESLDLIPSGGPVRYVLELNGGAVDRYGVKTGDRLRHPIIPDQALEASPPAP